MRLICGLGNPGAAFANTRHNAGFMAVDWIALKKQAHWGRPKEGAITARLEGEAMLLKPDTFMNMSGYPVSAISRYFKVTPARVLVVVDCAELEPGHIRLARSGSHAGHNGTRSVIEQLGTKDFPRLRIGVGRPRSRSSALADHMLGNFTTTELEALQYAVRRAALAVDMWLADGIDAAMNEYN